MNKTISKAENASAQPKIGTGIQSATGTKPQSEPRVPAPCTGTQSDPKSDPVAAKGCGFAFEINVEGDLHIHNHCASETAPIPPINEPVPCCAPIGDGNTCLPPIAGRKHKASPAQKFTKLAARNRVPSVLAAGAMHLVRRFLADVSPANPSNKPPSLASRKHRKRCGKPWPAQWRRLTGWAKNCAAICSTHAFWV